MTTSELINLLKEMDPDGTSHIRTQTGFPYIIELKEGMIDTPYLYLDNEDNLVLSTKGKKIDILTLDVWGYVQKNYRDDMELDEMLNKIKFDLTYRNQTDIDTRKNALIQRVKEYFDTIRKARTAVNSNNSSVTQQTVKSEKKRKPGLLKKWSTSK
jgi:hypothetical protein